MGGTAEALHSALTMGPHDRAVNHGESQKYVIKKSSTAWGKFCFGSAEGERQLLSSMSNSGDIAWTLRKCQENASHLLTVAPSGGRAASSYAAKRAALGQDYSSRSTTLNCSHLVARYDKGPMHIDILQFVSRMEGFEEVWLYYQQVSIRNRVLT
ncbi:hypothetical protein LTR41_011593 [Exophiala xenobiotica]|nr:hypothetical protein LTR41_011593 [Exophiala xenobiotica]KAK5550733.1 hypothetical protein LTR46_011271 [Exophiala xenobiotica]